ncbi:hypothetical protein D3C80_1815710 [compost metagenome]
MVGSLLPRVEAANRLTVSPSAAAPKMPTRLGQNAVRWLLHNRDRLPMYGHQENPAAILISTAIMKLMR